jgi:hypothetical protein
MTEMLVFLASESKEIQIILNNQLLLQGLNYHQEKLKTLNLRVRIQIGNFTGLELQNNFQCLLATQIE